ncbi:glycosyltransferase WbuB [Cohnella abietis]|uniref:Colanic acid biosynthesis glycosyltransferase WcaI n=1 Tax=Cohnella abietis TaxID=2507935 RepID=A0A3T1D135_9BACL|nr:glycosyltransferase WbuB [Cohnella abietis]BBI31771.1 colanic acid biosynthesis glycosyltransferase WcaI [Cohnella abietis]
MARSSRQIKLLLYSINFAPELTGIGKYNGEMVRWLAEHGYDVRVVTAPPYYPHWKVQEGYSAYRYTAEEWNGAKVWRCPVWVPKSGSGIKRLLHLFSFAVSSIPLLIRHMLWRPDVCLVVEPPIALSPMVVALAAILKVKTWLHVQDFEVDAAFELGILPNHKGLNSFIVGLEGWLMRRFNTVSSISEPMTQRLLKKGVSQSKIRLFPNWVDISAIHPLPESVRNKYRQEMGYRDGDLVVLYSGNMGEKQGLETVLDTAERLRSMPNITFILCGDGVAKKKLEEKARTKQLTNVRFLSLQPAEKLNELLNMADVHLLMQKRNASDLVMPSKLTGMLASGRAVIAMAEESTAVYTVIQQSRAGMLVPPEDADKLAEALVSLADRADDRKLCGTHAREYAVAHLGYNSVMSKFQQTMIEIGVGIK